MERKITKQEFKGIREVLGLTQPEMSELLGVSVIHICRVETNGVNSYGVSKKLDKLVKDKLKTMKLDIDEIIAIVNRGSFK